MGRFIHWKLIEGSSYIIRVSFTRTELSICKRFRAGIVKVHFLGVFQESKRNMRCLNRCDCRVPSFHLGSVSVKVTGYQEVHGNIMNQYHLVSLYSLLVFREVMMTVFRTYTASGGVQDGDFDLWFLFLRVLFTIYKCGLNLKQCSLICNQHW
jgi:hypothetical protein